MQSILWKLNKFDKLKEIKELDDYEPRHDPTVTPIHDASTAAGVSVTDLFPPRQRSGDIDYWTCSDYRARYMSGEITPTMVAEALLPLIRRDVKPEGKHSVAFLDSKVELVTQSAKASTERYKQNRPLSCLDGVPVAVKDEVELAGYKRMNGSRLDLTNPINQTGWCVRMLEEAGAIVIGKTNMHEMGLGAYLPA